MAKRQLTKMIVTSGPPRWRKMYRGKLYYFRGDYAEALAQWKEKEKELETEADVNPLLEAIANAPDETEAHKLFNDYANEHPDKVSPNQMGLALQYGYRKFAEMVVNGYEPTKPPTTTGKVKTVAQAMTAFLDFQRIKQKPLYFDLLRRAAEHFQSVIGGQTAVANLSGQHLTQYYTALAAKTKEGWSKSYAKLHMGVAKQFIGWCGENDYVGNLPKNIRSRNLAIEVDDLGEKVTFTNEEISTILTEASEEVKLYALLGLNCGFTQIDINDLIPSQVDFQSGRITRKRSKTKRKKNVPTVSYKLWPATLALLKKYQPPILHNGKPLITLREKGSKTTKTDFVKDAWTKQVERGLGIAKSFNKLRKTGSSRLENSQYATCADYFLGHAPQTIAQRHYKNSPTTYFDEAVAWLGRELGIVE